MLSSDVARPPIHGDSTSLTAIYSEQKRIHQDKRSSRSFLACVLILKEGNQMVLIRVERKLVGRKIIRAILFIIEIRPGLSVGEKKYANERTSRKAKCSVRALK